MPSVDAYLALLDEPRPLDIEDPEEEALLGLLVSVALSDGQLRDDELAFLNRILPDRDPEALRTFAAMVAEAGLDDEGLRQALPSVEQRWKGLRFAARMAWKDAELADAELALLQDLAEVLELPGGAVDTVLEEVQGQPTGGVEPDHLLEVLQDIEWDAVQLASGELTSRDLLAAVPGDAHLVARVGLDAVEVMGLFQEGLAGRFQEGTAFLPWRDIVAYTRVPVFGASVQLHDEDGRTWTLVDTRLRGVGLLLDRIFRAERPSPQGEPPVIEKVR